MSYYKRVRRFQIPTAECPHHFGKNARFFALSFLYWDDAYSYQKQAYEEWAGPGGASGKEAFLDDTIAIAKNPAEQPDDEPGFSSWHRWVPPYIYIYIRQTDEQHNNSGNIEEIALYQRTGDPPELTAEYRRFVIDYDPTWREDLGLWEQHVFTEYQGPAITDFFRLQIGTCRMYMHWNSETIPF